MTDRELMQQALEALTEYDGTNGESKRKRILVALRERLKQPEHPVQKPVAWKDRTYGNLHHQDFGNSIPLYTAPPPRAWQGLTEEEVINLWDGHVVPVFGKNGINPIVFARAIEDKLREKNT